MNIQIKYGTYNPSQLEQIVEEASSPKPQEQAPQPEKEAPQAQADTYSPSNDSDYWTRRTHEPYRPYS